ncbi:MAG TPA: VCBS repeat-containing protein, partial [Thermoanaerobaculia bacterium]|nr:VCBS repeat-containing protein [Thermoanaerobaculia bacterium]
MSISRKLLTLALALSALSLYGGNRAIDVPLRIPTGNTTKVAGVYAGDFTADGKTDLLQVEEGKLRVLPNNGTPSFGNAIVTDAGVMFPEGIADFNGDGRQDLYYRTATGAGVIEGNAGGTFGATHAVPLTRAATRMTAGELTGDAHLDLAVVSDADDMLTIYAGNGAGAFTLAREQTLSMYEPRDMAAADFDGDGRGDIIIANASVTNIAWNEGTTFSIAAFEGHRGTAVATGDVNGDGRTDAAAYGSSGATILYGGSTRGTPQTIGDLRGTDSVTVAVTIAPLDGDARDEIVIATSGSIIALSYDGTQFRPARAFLGGDGWSMHIAAADFTGDGHFDVVQSTDAYDVVDGYVTLARGRGDGTLRAPRRLLLSGLGNHRMSGNKPTITDLNGDTQPDIVIGMNDDDSIGVLMGRPDGSFAPVVATDLPRMDHPVLYEAGDLNGDGRMDMVRISSHTNWYAGGSMETWLGQSDGTFVAGPTRAFEPSNTGTAVFLQAVLDYTGDGY